VRNTAIVVQHHLLHVLGYDRDLGIRAGKSADGVERAPARDHQELDAALDRTAQDVGVDEAVDARELRKGVAPQVLDVFIGTIAARDTPPLPRDQAASG
jgi:hypothetical protein